MSTNNIVRTPSPSRTYVALCTVNFTSTYCKQFTLPIFEENSLDNARYYFLNVLDFTACLEFILTFEDYTNITEAKEN